MEKKFGKVIHLGIVVEDVRQSAAVYEKEFGITPWEISDHAVFFEDKIVNGSIGVDFASAIYREENFEIELISPVGPSVYADWLREHGPGLHHVKLETKESYDSVMEMAKRVSGKGPYLEIQWPDGKPIVGYADMLKQTGLLLEISKE